MLEAHLREESVDINRVRIIPLSDIEASIEEALGYVIRNVPTFTIAFSTHEMKEQGDWIKKEVDRIFAEEMKKRNIKIVKFRRTGTSSSTKIRDAIAYDGEWEHLTGKSVAGINERLDGISRIEISRIQVLYYEYFLWVAGLPCRGCGYHLQCVLK
jgi:nicotinamide mononucleotide adenylyltransferase